MPVLQQIKGTTHRTAVTPVGDLGRTLSGLKPPTYGVLI